MTITELRSYENWEGKSASYILQQVSRYGGWSKVFPTRIPKHIHRVRNYFNIVPMALKKLDYLDGLTHRIMRMKSYGASANLLIKMSTYKDLKGRIWVQMIDPGTGYHFEDRTWVDSFHSGTKAAASVIPYPIPVFKFLHCEPKTGGSSEVIIKNNQNEYIFGDTEHYISIINNIETNPKFLGTYNYSEATTSGNSAHHQRDVKPHEKQGKYLSHGKNLSSPLSSRIFPKLTT